MNQHTENGYLCLIRKELETIKNLDNSRKLKILREEIFSSNPGSLNPGCSCETIHYTGKEDRSFNEMYNEAN